MVDEVLGQGTHARVGADAGAERALFDMATRRLAGEPLQYVLGSWAFRTVELQVDPRALIPRPETEQVVEVALGEARRQLRRAQTGGAQLRRAQTGGPQLRRAQTGGVPFRVADLGTVSGAIALSIAVELGRDVPQLQVAATDTDPSAIELASANRLRVSGRHPHVGPQVELRRGSWFDALAATWRGRVHLVVSNPPYVSEDEWPSLDPQVRREPYGALVAMAGSDGTPGFAAVEAVLEGAHGWLAPGGAVVVEMAPHHARPALDLAGRVGYRDARVEPDLTGRARALVALR